MGEYDSVPANQNQNQANSRNDRGVVGRQGSRSGIGRTNSQASGVGRTSSQASGLGRTNSQASIGGRSSSQSYLRNYSPLPVDDGRRGSSHIHSGDCCHADEDGQVLSGPGGPLWNSLLARQGSKSGSLARADSRKQGLERHNSKNTGLGRQDSMGNTMVRQDSRTCGLGRQDSRSNGLGKQNSRNSVYGRQDSKGAHLLREDSRSNDMQRQKSRGGLFDKKSQDCSVHGEGDEEVEQVGEGWGGHLWNSLQLVKQDSRGQIIRQESRGSGLAKKDSGGKGVTRQDSRPEGLQKREMIGRQGSRGGGDLRKQDSRTGGLRKQGSQNGLLRRDDSRGGLHRERDNTEEHDGSGWGGPLWNSLQQRESEKAAPVRREGSRSSGMGRRDSRGAQKPSRTSFGSSTSCSLHPEPWEEIAQIGMGTGMGGGAAKSIWDSLQKEKQGVSLPRQDSRKSLKKQSSRKGMTEPFQERTNWKDSLRDTMPGSKNQHQGMDEATEANKFEPRRSISTRRSSFSSSLGREEDINTPFRSPSPARARQGTSSPSRSSCSSPTRVTDIASMEEDLANLRGQAGEGGNPLGDYVSFDKFRAGLSEGPSELG